MIDFQTKAKNTIVLYIFHKILFHVIISAFGHGVVFKKTTHNSLDKSEGITATFYLAL